MEILGIIVIAVLILGVAVGPLLAMRSPAEADKLTPGGRPGQQVGQGTGRQRNTTESPTPGTPRTSRRTRHLRRRWATRLRPVQEKKDGCVRSLFQPSA